MPVRTLTEVKNKYKVVAEDRGLFIRFGDLPPKGVSRDHFRNKELKGVSVYWAQKKGDLWFVNGDTVHPTYGNLCEEFAEGEREAYVVSGVEIGVGPDGEPLIKDAKIEQKLEHGELSDYEGKISRSYYWQVETAIKHLTDKRQRTAAQEYLRAFAKEYDTELRWYLEREEFHAMDLLVEEAMLWYYGEEQEVAAGSSVLYHWTEIHKLLDILTEDKFRLSTSSGTPTEKKLSKDKPFYFSCSRSKTGGYQWDKASGAKLVLDGAALAHNHEIKPIDYWGSAWKKAARDSNNAENLRQNTEMEDRVFSDKNIIKNASKYIKEIHLGLPSESANEDYLVADKSRARKVAILAKKLGIPVYFYDNKKDFQTFNKAKAVSVEHLSTPGFKKEHWVDFGGSRRLHKYIALYKAPNHESLPEDAQKQVSNLYYKDETVRDIEQWLHNSKMNSSKKEKESAAELTTLMHRKKWSTGDFVDFLRKKWINK